MTDPLKTVQALADALESFPGFAVDIGDERDTFVRKGKAALAEGRALIAQMQRDAVQPADVLEDQCPNCDPRRFCTRKECAAPQPAPEPRQDQLQQPDGHSTRASGVCASGEKQEKP